VIFVAALGYPLEHDRHPPAADGVCAGPPKR
jgi:hypothetical protein